MRPRAEKDSKIYMESLRCVTGLRPPKFPIRLPSLLQLLFSSAFTMYRYWGVRTSQLPHLLGMMDIMRRQVRLAFDLPHIAPRRMHVAREGHHQGTRRP